MEKEEGYVTKDRKGMEIKESWDPQQKKPRRHGKRTYFVKRF